MVALTHVERLPGIGLPPADSGARHRSGTATGRCRTIGDPMTQSLSDAPALLRTDDLPAGAAEPPVPLFCRLAMEARKREAKSTSRVADRDTHVH